MPRVHHHPDGYFIYSQPHSGIIRYWQNTWMGYRLNDRDWSFRSSLNEVTGPGRSPPSGRLCVSS